MLPFSISKRFVSLFFVFLVKILDANRYARMHLVICSAVLVHCKRYPVHSTLLVQFVSPPSSYILDIRTASYTLLYGLSICRYLFLVHSTHISTLFLATLSTSVTSLKHCSSAFLNGAYALVIIVPSVLHQCH